MKSAHNEFSSGGPQQFFDSVQQQDGNYNKSNESTLHPFLVDIILGTLVDFMDYENQKVGRLVCTKWNRAILPEFIKLATVNIKFDGDDMFLMDEELISVLPLGPERSKRYQHINIHSMKWLNSLVFRNWIADYGKSMKTLTLGKGEEDEIEDLEDVEEISLNDLESLLLDWCPSLTELRLPIPYICIQTSTKAADSRKSMTQTGSALKTLLLGSSKWFKDDYQDIGMIGRLILGIAPNLTTLAMNSCQARGVDLLINNVKGSPTGKSLEKLETLDLHRQVMNANIVQELGKLNFAYLRNLGLGDVGEVEDQDRFWSSVSDLLKNVSSSLEMLSFGETYNGSLSVGDFPILPKLKKFVNHHVRGWMLRNIDCLFSFPNLEYCMLDSRCVYATCGHTKGLFEHDDNMQLIHKPHMKLLTLVMTCGIQDMFVLKNIVQCFPNLQTLHIRLTFNHNLPIHDSLEEISKLLKMERLWINTDKPVNDLELAVLTGLPKFQALKSFLIEGDTYLYLKMEEETLRDRVDAKSLIGVISSELKMSDVELERLKTKCDKTDLNVKIIDGTKN